MNDAAPCAGCGLRSDRRDSKKQSVGDRASLEAWMAALRSAHAHAVASRNRSGQAVRMVASVKESTQDGDGDARLALRIKCSDMYRDTLPSVRMAVE